MTYVNCASASFACPKGIFGELDEDIFCRFEAHNCYFNPSPYAVEDLKIVFDAFASTSVVSSNQQMYGWK
jgi:hypothetical protein